MKTLKIILLAIASGTLFASCEVGSGQTKGLSNAQTRNEIMEAIASDSVMSNEMIHTMMSNKNGMMIMQNHQRLKMENHNSMMNMVKTNPGMTQNMMSALMETAKSDTSKMSEMIKIMMDNPQMMKMMQNRMGNSNSKMKGMKQMGGASN